MIRTITVIQLPVISFCQITLVKWYSLLASSEQLTLVVQLPPREYIATIVSGTSRGLLALIEAAPHFDLGIITEHGSSPGDLKSF